MIKASGSVTGWQKNRDARAAAYNSFLFGTPSPPPDTRRTRDFSARQSGKVLVASDAGIVAEGTKAQNDH